MVMSRVDSGRHRDGRPCEGTAGGLALELPLLSTLTYTYAVLSQEIIKVAFENGINMFDTAEAYAKGKSEEEMCVYAYLGPRTGQ